MRLLVEKAIKRQKEKCFLSSMCKAFGAHLHLSALQRLFLPVLPVSEDQRTSWLPFTSFLILAMPENLLKLLPEGIFTNLLKLCSKLRELRLKKTFTFHSSLIRFQLLLIYIQVQIRSSLLKFHSLKKIYVMCFWPLNCSLYS